MSVWYKPERDLLVLATHIFAAELLVVETGKGFWMYGYTSQLKDDGWVYIGDAS